VKIAYTVLGCVSQKYCKPKLIVKNIGGIFSMINLGLQCFWETQPCSIQWKWRSMDHYPASNM